MNSYRTRLGILAIILLGLLLGAMGFVFTSTPVAPLLDKHTHVHSMSPAYAGIGVKSTLENGDTLNCVVKTSPGWFRALSRTFNNGKVTDVVRANEWGEVNCHYTGVNNGAHLAGSDPASYGGPINWADKSDHGT